MDRLLAGEEGAVHGGLGHVRKATRPVILSRFDSLNKQLMDGWIEDDG